MDVDLVDKAAPDELTTDVGREDLDVLPARGALGDVKRFGLIAESPRFPDLRERTFDFGTLPVLSALKRFLQAANAEGTARVDDPDLAATQFLGMIATVLFWPRLVHGGWSLSDEESRGVVEEAVETIVARYGAPVRD